MKTTTIQGGWFVYLLKCSDGSYYAGMTNDVEKRMATHKAGKGSKYVSQKKSFELAHCIECSSGTDARKIEAAVKKLKPAQKTTVMTEIERCQKEYDAPPVSIGGFCMTSDALTKKASGSHGEGVFSFVVEKEFYSANAALIAGFDVNTEAEYGHYRTVDLRRGGKEYDGTTLLMEACYALNLPLVRMLLDRGASVNKRDHGGAGVLLYAMRSYRGLFLEKLDIAKLLVDHGAGLENGSATEFFDHLDVEMNYSARDQLLDFLKEKFPAEYMEWYLSKDIQMVSMGM